MKFYLIIIILIVAILATMALTGYIFYRIAKHYFDNQQKMQMLQMRVDEHREAVKLVTVLRCYQPGMDTKLLQGVMTKTIRDEWEHNLSQQVYISSEAWNRIRQAKDEMVGVINSAAITIPDDADPARLASTIFATVAAGSNPAAPALEFLKQEMRDL